MEDGDVIAAAVAAAVLSWSSELPMLPFSRRMGRFHVHPFRESWADLSAVGTYLLIAR